MSMRASNARSVIARSPFLWSHSLGDGADRPSSEEPLAAPSACAGYPDGMSSSGGAPRYRQPRMRIGALDLGSNSFHLLVADVHPDGTFASITREKDMLRLGDEVAREGRITETTAKRVVDSARHLKQLADASGATEVIAKATSAIRSATYSSEL